MTSTTLNHIPTPRESLALRQLLPRTSVVRNPSAYGAGIGKQVPAHYHKACVVVLCTYYTPLDTYLHFHLRTSFIGPGKIVYASETQTVFSTPKCPGNWVMMKYLFSSQLLKSGIPSFSEDMLIA